VTHNVQHLDFVHWFRASSPYIHAFRGRTFVISLDGDAVIDANFSHIIHDIALLNSLGIRLVLVHGARPQIDKRLLQRSIEAVYHNNIRITDDHALVCVKEAVGIVRVEIEALLSMGLANSPMAGARLRVAAGNWVTARPVGVRDGIDFMHTGEIRKIDHQAINEQLNNNAIVLISPLGYSLSGEVFNLSHQSLAAAVASDLGASKLIYLAELKTIRDSNRKAIRHLQLHAAQELLSRRKKMDHDLQYTLNLSIEACGKGVDRIHLVNRHIDGALLLELFTRDGVGTMINADTYDGLRAATIDDIGGILELIEPLEANGALVRRSREQLELQINHFTVIERDGMITACAALIPFQNEAAGELACLVAHPEYQQSGRANRLLEHVEKQALDLGLKQLYVLTTRTAHWFREHGFSFCKSNDLPMQRRALYNYRRNSKVLFKNLK